MVSPACRHRYGLTQCGLQFDIQVSWINTPHGMAHVKFSEAFSALNCVTHPRPVKFHQGLYTANHGLKIVSLKKLPHLLLTDYLLMSIRLIYFLNAIILLKYIWYLNIKLFVQKILYPFHFLLFSIALEICASTRSYYNSKKNWN